MSDHERFAHFFAKKRAICSENRWAWKFFLIRQNRSTNQRSVMILEVQIQIFGEHAPCAPAHARQSFHFQKIPEGPNINHFLWKLAWSFFYFKEQMKKYKFEILLLKSTILDPQKEHFWLEENPPKKCVLYVSALIQL